MRQREREMKIEIPAQSPDLFFGFNIDVNKSIFGSMVLIVYFLLLVMVVVLLEQSI